MIKNKGFTLIELFITLAIVMCFVIIIATAINSDDSMWTEQLQIGGTICKGGVLFNNDLNGYQTQIIGANGFPVACTTK